MLKTQLPLVYTLRSCTLADAAAIADLGNCWSQALLGVNSENVDNFRSLFQAPGFSLEEDTLLVLNQDQQPVGYAELYDIQEPHVRMMCYAFVHPEHTHLGIGTYLVDWMVERAGRGVGRAPAGARVTLTEYLPAQEHAGAEILMRKGFQAVRANFMMRIDMTNPPAPEKTPAGIQIRPINMETDFEEAVRVVRRSFRDHYGFVEEPFEYSLGRWRHIISHNPHFDPSLWFLALDGEQVCGVCYCTPFTEEDPEMGWVQTLGVLREWRGRGVGLALLQTAFTAFYLRGMVKVGLGVDAESLTGATRLYEKAGMRVFREYHAYELELRPGLELSTQKLD